MGKVRSKALYRWFAALLSFVMVFSVIPFSSVAFAEVDGAQKGVTVTVLDVETGLPIEGAAVAFTVTSATEGDEAITGSVLTDAEGVAKVLSADKYEEGALSLSATVTKDGYTEGEITEEDITTEDQNFEVKIAGTVIDDVEIKGLDLTYTGSSQALVSVTEIEGDVVKYFYPVDATEGSEDVPRGTDAGEYEIKVVVKRGEYKELTEMVKAKISPAEPEVSIKGKNLIYEAGTEQELVVLDGEFAEEDKLTWIITKDEGAAEEIVSAEIPRKAEMGKYEIMLKVDWKSDNYKNIETATVTTTISESLITFPEPEVEYVLGTENGKISEQEAEIDVNAQVQEKTYALTDADALKEAVAIDENGKVTVVSVEELAEMIRAAGGSLKLEVTATKPASETESADSASYFINVIFETTPEAPINLPAVSGNNGWYREAVTVTPAEGYQIAKSLSDEFEETVDIQESGFVYLKNELTGGITDKVDIDGVKVDAAAPMNLSISFDEENGFKHKIGELFGFYTRSVTITFTAKDTTSGVDHFDWTYTKDGATEGVKEEITELSEPDENGAVTASVTLPKEEAEQLRGTVYFSATDKAGNESDNCDAEHIFVIDTINPKMRITYAGDKDANKVGDIRYFNSDVTATLTVEETNFDADGVTVSVSKDGGEAEPVTVSWDGQVGTFALEGDGDYVVSVKCVDLAGNALESDYQSEVITVDKTTPEVDLAYDGEKQTVTVTVEEHNFNAADITVGVKAANIIGEAVAAKDIQAYARKTENWTAEGDVHTLVMDKTVLNDAIYEFTVNYTDLAGNAADEIVLADSVIDWTAPDAKLIEISYSKSLADKALEIITLGFYNHEVTVTFTAHDMTAGVKEFKWAYEGDDSASDVNLDTYEGVAEVTDRDGSKATASVKLPVEAAQLRGKISVQAVDAKGNTSDKKTDDGNIIVVDTINPKMTVEYSAENSKVGTTAYYTGEAEVTLNVTEANFFAEDVKVSVSKDGAAAETVEVAWEDKNTDLHVGEFTLNGDGDYVVYVEYKDKSQNLVTDKNGNVFAVESGETVVNQYQSHVITIDTVDPVISVKYDDDKVPVINVLKDQEGNDRKYYADTKTATVTINEHNFNAEDVVFTVVAKDVSGTELNAAALNTKSAWSTAGDVHTMTITYPGDANYTFDVAYTDLATRKAKSPATAYFTVDKTAPENLKVEYSSGVLDTVLEAVGFGFYNAKMTVTLTAEDPTSEVHSFLYSYLNAEGVSQVNAQLIEEAIEAAEIGYSKDRKTATVKFQIPKDVLNRESQFNGTVEFLCADRSDNTTDMHKESKRIVVDNIAPTAQVSYNTATNIEDNVAYYDGDITATVTINEANFYANDVTVMVSKDGTSRAVTPSWRHSSVDVHIGTFTLTEDGDYVVTINYRDKSSNNMTTYTSGKMVIDTQIAEPVYTINGAAKTAQGGAYKGDATIGFSFDDQNFDSKTIKLTRTRFDKVEDLTAEYITVTNTTKGGFGSFSIPAEVENDGIYVLSIGMIDKAEHSTGSEIKFTLNRYGSVYEYDEELMGLIKDGGQYVTSVDKDIVITEYNADRILEGSLKLLITRDGEAIEADYTSNPEKIDDKAAIGDSGWYQYVYTIKASNFEQDGVYKIALTSEYAAEDSAKNESTSVPDNSMDTQGNAVLDTMTFTVDSAAPEIRNIVNLEEAIVNAQSLDVKYTVIDVGGLKSIEIILNGETIETITEFGESLFNYTGQFTIDENTEAQTVRIRVTDIAGNVTDTAAEDFNAEGLYIFNDEVTVSTNFLVRWYANKALFWGSVGGVVVLAAVLCAIFATKKKK